MHDLGLLNSVENFSLNLTDILLVNPVIHKEFQLDLPFFETACHPFLLRISNEACKA